MGGEDEPIVVGRDEQYLAVLWTSPDLDAWEHVDVSQYPGLSTVVSVG